MNQDELPKPEDGVNPPVEADPSFARRVPGPAPNPWTLRNLLVLLGCALLALVAANILAVTGYKLLNPSINLERTPEVLRYNTLFHIALLLIFYGLFLGVIYLFVVVNSRLPFWKALKWRKASPSAIVWCAMGGAVLAILIQFVPPLLPSSREFPLERLFNSPTSAYAIAAFAILLAPFMEELIFRGLLFAFLEQLTGVAMAVVGTALLFAALHVSQYWGAWNHVVLIGLVGFCFSLVRGLSGSVMPSYILHVAYNATLIAGLFFQTDYFRSFPAHLG